MKSTGAGRTAWMMVLLGCANAAAAQERDAGMDWMVAPYLWAVSANVDLNTRQPPIESDTDFPGIIDKIDGAFQIHIEGQGERFGLLADFTYLGLSADERYARLDTASDLDVRLFEAAAVWSPAPGTYSGPEVFAGLRYIDVDLTIRFDPHNAQLPGRTLDGGRSYSDLMLGARYGWTLSPRWKLVLRGDTSFGDTEGTWNASATALYRTGNGQWILGYRYLDVEIETLEADSRITLYGPMLGYGFRF